MSRTVCSICRRAFAWAIGLSVYLCAITTSVRADDFIVYSPDVAATQSEVELRSYQFDDPRAQFSGGNAAELSVAHAFNGWWKPELYLAQYQNTPGNGGRLIGYEFENTFQLTPAGKYWADLGLLASYEYKTAAHLSDAVEFGPLIEKAAGRFTHIVNLIWEKPVLAGASSKYEFRYSYQGTYALTAALRPGVEFYGRPSDRAYQAGPVVAGEWHLPGTASNLEYRVGAVIGLNAAAPRRTWLAQIEYEFF